VGLDLENKKASLSERKSGKNSGMEEIGQGEVPGKI
jgi:hypothetical protein